MLAIKQKHIAFIISIGLHAAILLALGLIIDLTEKQLKIGDAKRDLVTSYIYTGKNSQTSLAKKTIVRPQAQHNKLTAISIKKNISSAQAEQVNKQKSISTNDNQQDQITQHASSAGAQASELIALLHAAIQKQQRYPETAMQMEREGTVTVVFKLYANGSISQLRIAKSSGTDSLDEAALTAINKAAPFEQVDKYLQNSQEYRIDVVFALA